MGFFPMFIEAFVGLLRRRNVIVRIEQLAAATLREMVGEGARIEKITLTTEATAPGPKYQVAYITEDGKREAFELDRRALVTS
jgi:hypothetical protein